MTCAEGEKKKTERKKESRETGPSFHGRNSQKGLLRFHGPTQPMSKQKDQGHTAGQ